MRRTWLRVALALALVHAGVPGPGVRAEEGTPGEGGEGVTGGLDTFVTELRAEAERIRGLTWKEEVPVAALSREKLRENFLEMVEEELDPEELARDTRILRRLGMLGPEEDAFQLMLFAMENMVGGYYDPKARRLFLVEGMTGAAQKPVILHELIHALEDQYFGLESRVEPFEDDPDRAFAEQCLVEGSAEHARRLYQRSHPADGRAYVSQQASGVTAGRQMEVVAKVPAYLILPTMLHYQLGPRLVARVVGDDYPGAMTRLYGYGPVSQEQLLHPSRWLGPRQDYPRRVVWGADFAQRAGEGWTKLDDLPSGELDLALFLDFFLGFTQGKLNVLLLAQGEYVVPRAKTAAAGWDGGRSYFMEDASGRIIWLDAMVFDTVDDATEARDALVEVLRRANGDGFVLEDETPTGQGTAAVDLVYRGRHGLGRLLQRGAELLVVDGAETPELRERLTAALLETTFEVDPRDTWDPTRVESPLAGCTWSDESARIGLKLPGEGFSVETARGRPGLVARIEKGAVRVELSVLPFPVELVRPRLEQRLQEGAPGAEASGPVATRVAGGQGWCYEVPGRRLYLGDADGRSVMLDAEGPGPALSELRDDLDRIAAGIVSALD